MPECPKCGGKVTHVHRRPIDKLMSAFVPLHRYACRDKNCAWAGNIRRDLQRVRERKKQWLKILLLILLVIVCFLVGKKIADHEPADSGSSRNGAAAVYASSSVPVQTSNRLLLS